MVLRRQDEAEWLAGPGARKKKNGPIGGSLGCGRERKSWRERETAHDVFLDIKTPFQFTSIFSNLQIILNSNQV
jgi:hypothetical protein